MNRGIKALIHIIENTQNKDIRSRGVNFFVDKWGVSDDSIYFNVNNFLKVRRELCDSSINLLLLGHNLFNGGCMVADDFGIKERDYVPYSFSKRKNKL